MTDFRAATVSVGLDVHARSVYLTALRAEIVRRAALATAASQQQQQQQQQRQQEPGNSAEVIDLAFYTFDRAAEIAPVVQLEADLAAPWVGHIADLPRRDPKSEPHLAGYYSTVVSKQHPDHDT